MYIPVSVNTYGSYLLLGFMFAVKNFDRKSAVIEMLNR